MSNVKLRPATEADVPTILQLIRELAEFEKEPDSAAATPELMREALFGTNPVAHAVVAEDEGVGIGMAVYFFNFSTWTGRPGLHLEDLYVRPSHRGQGVARRLFAYLARVAIERGCGRLELAVLDWNVNAIRLYDGLGGVPMTGWTTYRFAPDTIARIAADGTAPILNR